jgi:hypothetical protein
MEGGLLFRRRIDGDGAGWRWREGARGEEGPLTKIRLR